MGTEILPRLRVELHAHSCYSKDSILPLEKILEACRRRGVQVVAITDHNEIEGAVKLQKVAPDDLQVIVGEEIATADGDLIGLFLQERITPRLPIEETIAQIRAQNGLVMVPHPFDRLRHEAMGESVLERIYPSVDFIEIFNARCVFRQDNQRASAYVSRRNLAGYVCSDAHWSMEYGVATCLVEPYEGVSQFAENLRNATFEYRRSTPLVHAGTAVVKRGKALARKLKHENSY